MKKDIVNEIIIPEGVEVLVDENKVLVKGKEGELSRTFRGGKFKIEKKENKIIVRVKNGTKKEKKIINTISKHIANMIHGVQEKFEYTLKICFSHFPITIDIKGNTAEIKNFLGEKINRTAKIPEGAEISVQKDIITVKAVNKEIAGQASANLERATRITKRDRRIFQDGIFITNKPKRDLK